MILEMWILWIKPLQTHFGNHRVFSAATRARSESLTTPNTVVCRNSL